MTNHHDAGHAHHAHHDDADDADDADDLALADLLDLDGQVLHGYWTHVLAWVQDAAAGSSQRRILDLGAGTGTAAIALARRFADAEVVAVDASEQMLKRIRAKASDVDLTQRIRVLQADLDDVWPDVGAVDLTWASMSLHHLADPDRVLVDVFAATRPGGLIAVAEMAEPLRFLPYDLGFGRPGLEDRCLDALEHEHARLLPDLGSDWAPRLAAAGFTVLDERAFAVDPKPPHSPESFRYARLWLQRMRSGLEGRLAHDDLETLATLLDSDGPDSLRQRDDLHIRGIRTVTLARRP